MRIIGARKALRKHQYPCLRHRTHIGGARTRAAAAAMVRMHQHIWRKTPRRACAFFKPSRLARLVNGAS
jgi:hypothetical protein